MGQVDQKAKILFYFNNTQRNPLRHPLPTLSIAP
jgi:hypothetical protein